MAEAIIISALLPVVFEKAAALIENQLGIVLGADAESELGKLQSTLSTVQAVLEDAEERQVTDKALRLWLSGLKDAAYQADDVLEDFTLDVTERSQQGRDHHKITAKVLGCFPFCVDRALVRPRMCRNIRDIAEKFDSLAVQRSKFHLKERAGSVRDERSPTHSYVPESEVVGREDDVKRIVELLRRQEHEKSVAVLPIVGMGGLGKTTLTQMVYNHPAVADHFELRVWVSVMTLDNFSAARVAKALIETGTGSGFGPSDMDSLQRNLRKLIGARRFLLVLDDVWNEDPQRWEEVKILLTFGAQGSAVVVTTRSGIASSIMGTLDTLWLEQLSEDACWTLFSRRAFAGREEDPGLVAIGRAIVGKCGRLPLAAKALGGLMQLKQEESEWRAVMESKIWDLPLGQSGIQPVLLLSYHHLPSHLKQCFAFCAIFPRDYQIEKETLIKLWMANGFIPTATGDMAELKGHEIFQALEQRCFFQNVKEVGRSYDGKRITTCMMHDLIHDLVRSVAGSECCIIDKWEEGSDSYHGSRHLFVNCEVVGNQTAAASKGKRAQSLRTLLFRDKQSDLMSTIWSDAKYLRALGLHNAGLSAFPTTIYRDLRHLRYLDLSCNDIKALPEDISRLFNLQTLILSACGKLLGLPKTITRMSSLMHLYLEGCTSLRSMPAGMGQLRRLQALTRYVAGDEAGGGRIGELNGLNLHGMLELYNLKSVASVADAREANLGSKANLQQLDFDWGESDPESGAGIAEEVLEALQPHPKLKQLAIRRYRGTRYPTWLMGAGDSAMLLSKLVEVVLADCSRCEHLPQLWQLPHLEVLEIGGMEPMTQLGGSEFYGTAAAAQVFPSLRRLKLYGMPNLKAWSAVAAGRAHFSRIAEIEIIDCPNLMTMPALPSARSLKISNCPLLSPANGFFGCMRSLERLDMVSCDDLVLMLEQEDEPTGPLVHLHIKNCNKSMFSSPSFGQWKHFNSLQNLEIRNCDGLVIFPVHVLQCLSSLKRLSMHCCYSLMGSAEEEEGLSFRGLTALEELDVQVCTEFPCFHPEGLKRLTALKRLLIYSNHGLTDLPDFPDSVQTVTFYNNWSLDSLPEGLGRLPSLESLTFLNLHQVTSLPEEMHGYKALNSLKLEDCPRVTSFPIGLQQRLPSLKYLDIRDCPDLERQCRPGGEYWNLISRIPVKYIGGDA